MKKLVSKWLKWKVGALGMFALILTFHEMKASPAFEQASARASTPEGQEAGQPQSRDPVLREWQQSPAYGSGERHSQPARNHRQSAGSADRSGGDELNGGISAGPGDRSQTGPHTRTGRS